MRKDLKALDTRVSAARPRSADKENPVVRLCRRLAKELKTADTSLKQHLLWQVVDQIVFEGKQVQIAMKIPLQPETCSPSESIADASSYQTGRNRTQVISLTRRIPATAKTYRTRVAA